MDYFTSIRKKKNIIIIITCLIVLVSLAFSFLSPLEYSSTNKLLVIQPSESNIDVYNSIKSVERTSEKLSQVIYTSSFFDKVMNSGFNIDSSYFNSEEKKKRKQWEKMISTQVIRGSGMLKINVYHTSKFQAQEINRAIGYVLNTNSWEYIGNKNIQIKEVDSPLVSNWPVRPNFALNGFMGLLLGLIVSFAYIFLAEQKRVMEEKNQANITDIEAEKNNSIDNSKSLTNENNAIINEVNANLVSKEAKTINENISEENSESNIPDIPVISNELDFELAANEGCANYQSNVKNQFRIDTMHDHI